MRSVKNTYSQRIIRSLHRALGGCCYICGSNLNVFEITKDHVFPKSQGYSINANMMPAHFDCNNEKADREPTLAEIEISIAAYDSVGCVFDPRIILINKDIMTRPLDYFTHSLKEAA